MADHQVITNSGLALAMSCLELGHKIEFVSFAMGNGAYTEEQKTESALKRMASLKDQKQSFGFASFEREEGQVSLEVRATNEGLSEGYYMTEYGVYARDANLVDAPLVLYEVGVEDNPSYMPEEDLAPTVVNVMCVTAVYNSLDVTVVISQTAYALQRDLTAAREDTAALDLRVTALEESPLPIATRERLGAVKVGDNLKIKADGTMYLPEATYQDIQEILAGTYDPYDGGEDDTGEIDDDGTIIEEATEEDIQAIKDSYWTD